MPYYTRRRRGGGPLNWLRGKKNTNQQQIASLETQARAAARKSQSRVANILAQPGEFKYTDKERIFYEYQDLMDKIEKPQESVSAVATVIQSMETALKSPAARETGAVVITLPVFIVQLFIKAARVFLALMIFLFGIGPSLFGAENALAKAVYAAAPNVTFNTTEAAYKYARKVTGASQNNRGNVVEYS